MPFKQTTKEFVRASLARAKLYDVIRKLRGKSLDHLAHDRLEDRFSHIYQTGMWALGDPSNPGSGSGSSLRATGNIRRELPDLLRKIKTRCLLDVGCGDFTWMKELDLSDIDYIGSDIVDGVVHENNVKYGRNGIRFIQSNALADELPDADVILAREILFHLSFEDIFAALRNMVAKSRAWFLITSDHSTSFNANIRSGDWRLLNLQRAPFNLPDPVHSIDDSGICPERRLMCWKGEQIRQVLRL